MQVMKSSSTALMLTGLALAILPFTAMAQPTDAAEDQSAVESKSEVELAREEAREAKAAAEAALAALEELKNQSPATRIADLFSRSRNAAPVSAPDEAVEGYFNYCPVQGIDGGTLTGDNGLQWPYFTTTTIGVSGDIWADTSYRKGKSTKTGEPDEEQFLSQGRGVLRFTPTYVDEDNWFVQGEVEVVGDKNQSKDISRSSDTDDVWVKFGQWGKPDHNWDVQVGRFEAWSLFHLGMGLDLDTLERRGAIVGSTTPPAFYGVTYMYYRPTNNLGNIALHYYPSQSLRMEVLLQTGFDSLNSVGGRGAVIYDKGFIKLKAGGEYKERTPVLDGFKNDETYWGLGGAVQFVLDPWIEFGGHYAFSDQEVIKFDGGKNLDATQNRWSGGGFVNLSPWAGQDDLGNLSFGAGVDYTSMWDDKEDDDGNVGIFSHLQGFGAVQYRLLSNLEIKAIYAYALADMEPSFAGSTGYYEATMHSFRLRFRYYF